MLVPIVYKYVILNVKKYGKSGLSTKYVVWPSEFITDTMPDCIYKSNNNVSFFDNMVCSVYYIVHICQVLLKRINCALNFNFNLLG